MSPARSSTRVDTQSSPAPQTSPAGRSPLVENRTLTFNDIFAIQRPPLPKGSQEFESLIAEFRPPPAGNASSLARKKKVDKTSRPQHLLLQQWDIGSPSAFNASHMASVYRRQGGALSLSAVLSQKRILKWLQKKQSGQRASSSPCNTARS